jgi:hypothetical protein
VVRGLRVALVHQRMVVKKPVDRFQSMQAVIAALQSLPQTEAAACPPSIDFRGGPMSPASTASPVGITSWKPRAISFRRQGRLQASAAGNWLGPKPPPLEQLSTPKKIPPNPIAALFGRRALRFSNGVLMEACQPNLFPTTIEPSDLLIEGLPEKESRGDRT